MLPLSTQIYMYKWVPVNLMLEGDLVVDKQANLTQSTNSLHRETKCFFFSSFRLMSFLYMMGT